MTVIANIPLSPSATEQLLQFNFFAREAVQTAINDAALRQAKTDNEAERRAIAGQLIKLFDEQMNLEAMNIVLVANSPAMQEALRGLTAVVADLEKAAAKLKDATKFVEGLTKVTGFAGSAVKALDNALKIGAKPPQKKKPA
jgi:hypothetical protein